MANLYTNAIAAGILQHQGPALTIAPEPQFSSIMLMTAKLDLRSGTWILVFLIAAGSSLHHAARWPSLPSTKNSRLHVAIKVTCLGLRQTGCSAAAMAVDAYASHLPCFAAFDACIADLDDSC